jgi:hypothetical protein
MAEGREPPDHVRVENGDWLVPVTLVQFADDREAEAYALADLQTTILGGWDDSELQTIVRELEAQDLLAGTRFEDFFEDTVYQDTPELLIDRAAELQKKWKTIRGQLWEIGLHRLLCGDSTEESEGRRLMNGARAVLFVTDPPYLVGYDGRNHPHRWTKTHGRSLPGD